MKGYLVRYRYKGAEPSPSYEYQRFFRALYGYTQVVTKSNGKTYVYYREGVLTTFPFIREGRSTVIVPENALEPLIEFFKTGKNPAHDFSDLSNWVVTYYVENVSVDAPSALRAIYDALGRVMFHTTSGYVRLIDVVKRDVLTPDELLGVGVKAKNIVSSSWFRELEETDPLLSRLSDLFNRSRELLS